MDSDEKHLQVTKAIVELRAKVEQLIGILAATGTLNAGQKRILDTVASVAGASLSKRVRLRQYDEDKYQVANADIDCAARMPLCHGRCCSFTFELSAQDVEEGVVRWNLDEPYVIRRDADRRCTHLDRDTLGCTVYAHRPAVCRSFSCKDDPRIWVDFEKRIPAP